MMRRNLMKIGLATLVAFGIAGYTTAQDDDPFADQVSYRDNDPFGGHVTVQPIESASQAKKSVNRTSEDLIREALESKVNLEYDENPFIEVMDEFREVYGINVMLDQSAMDDSLSADDLITFNSRNISLKSGLRLMLDSFNATYVVRNEVLLIISKDVARNPEFFTRRIINCRLLIEKIRAADQRGKDAITNVYQISDAPQKDLGGQSSGGGVFNLVPGDKVAGLVDGKGQIDIDEQAKTWFLVQRGFDPGLDLINTVKISIAPDDWDDTNGDGSITLVGGCLVVQQTEEVADDIEKLLVELASSMNQE